MNVNDFADFCLQFFTFVYFDFTFSMLLYKIYCAKYIKSKSVRLRVKRGENFPEYP